MKNIVIFLFALAVAFNLSAEEKVSTSVGGVDLIYEDIEANGIYDQSKYYVVNNNDFGVFVLVTVFKARNVNFHFIQSSTYLEPKQRWYVGYVQRAKDEWDTSHQPMLFILPPECATKANGS